MTLETESVVEYSRQEAVPYATALSNLFLVALSGFEEFAGARLRGMEIPEGMHYAFERGTFTRGDYAYAVTIGEGDNSREFGISRSRGEKVDPVNRESLVIFIDNTDGASVSYVNGFSTKDTGGAVRVANCPEAVAGGYQLLNDLLAIDGSPK